MFCLSECEGHVPADDTVCDDCGFDNPGWYYTDLEAEEIKEIF